MSINNSQENVPHERRSISGIHRFMLELVRSSSERTSNISDLVQHIHLPSHHQDKEGDQPKCKGFALVTLSLLEDVAELLQQWPWHPRRTDYTSLEDNEIVRNAVKVGCRMLSKARWEQLGKEYLAYGQLLLDQITQEEDAAVYTRPERCGLDNDSGAISTSVTVESNTIPVSSFSISTSYPQGCLVFVRNVHPETNKTTLRALFSRPFGGSEVSEISGDVVDYVDFNKGSGTVRKSYL